MLSAGGMFGAYQAGVWETLSEWLQPDIVVGASVGALNGCAIAGGCSGDGLSRLWLDPLAGRAMRPRSLADRARDLMRDYPPRVPFGVVITDALRLRSRLETQPDWRHLVASCSALFVFPPARIAGRFYVDGGLLGALPIWAGFEMGATQVIAINCLPLMPSRVVRAGVRLVRWISPERRVAPSGSVHIITPSQPLGDITALVRWRERNVRRWIELGRADAAATLSSPVGEKIRVIQKNC